jgi:serine/threonine protein phosphatase PrpC
MSSVSQAYVQGCSAICGSHEERGKRPTMEDEILSVPLGQVGSYLASTASLHAVFDGHGGKECSAYAAGVLTSMLVRELQKGTDIHMSLHKTITQLDRNFMKSSGSDAGSTAIVCLYDGYGMVHCANVGDSRAVLCRAGGTAQDLSVDQKATRRDEVVRITEAGGYIARGRVLGSLAVSRALGDGDMKRQIAGVVIPDPELQTVPLRETDEFILCACDGVWDVMSSQDAITFVRTRLRGLAAGKRVGQGRAKQHSSRSKPSRKTARAEDDGAAAMNDSLSDICADLVHECINVRRSTDNVSVLLVCFQSAEQGLEQQELRQRQQEQEQQEQQKLRQSYRKDAQSMQDKIKRAPGHRSPGCEREGKVNGSKTVGRDSARARRSKTADRDAQKDSNASRRKQKPKPNRDTCVMTFQQRRRQQQRLQLGGKSSNDADEGAGGMALSPSLSATDATSSTLATASAQAKKPTALEMLTNRRKQNPSSLKWWEKPIKGRGKTATAAAGAAAAAGAMTSNAMTSAGSDTAKSTQRSAGRGLQAIKSPTEARRRSMVESYKLRLRENLGIGSGGGAEEAGGAWGGGGDIGESERMEEERQQQQQQQQQRRGRGRGAGAFGARRLVARTPADSTSTAGAGGASSSAIGGSASTSSLESTQQTDVSNKLTFGRRLSRKLPNIAGKQQKQKSR